MRVHTHTGEKPFNCFKCDESFSKSDHLKIREDPHRRKAIPIIQAYEEILTSRQLEET